MISKLAAAAVLFAGLALALPGCNTKPPRQAEAADALADKGADMASGSERTATLKPVDEIKPGTEAAHEKCCGQCKKALAKDRSGGAPATIPCTDFTADLDVMCLEHFRGKKTMAAECK